MPSFFSSSATVSTTLKNPSSPDSSSSFFSRSSPSASSHGRRRKRFHNSRCPVNPQHLDELRDFAQVAQRVARRFVVAAQESHVKNVLPRAPAPGPRFDLAQADIAQREDAQRFEECPGQVFHLEGDGSLVGPAGNQALVAVIDYGVPHLSPVLGEVGIFPCLTLPNQEEAREVALVVLDAGLENLAGIFMSRLPSGNPGRVFQPLGDDVLHASGRVVEGYCLKVTMMAEFFV